MPPNTGDSESGVVQQPLDAARMIPQGRTSTNGSDVDVNITVLVFGSASYRFDYLRDSGASPTTSFCGSWNFSWQ